MRPLLVRSALLIALFGTFRQTAAHANDDSFYPTASRAEYVFACMASNGQSRDALRRCSRAIDVIASIPPYDRYEEAETVLRMRRSGGGYLSEIFRSGLSNTMVRGKSIRKRSDFA